MSGEEASEMRREQPPDVSGEETSDARAEAPGDARAEAPGDRHAEEPSDGHLVVDAMNVIGSRPDGWWRDREGAMRDLVARLEAYAERTGQPVTAVLEGRPFELAPVRPGVRVTFASRRGADAADDEIVALVAAAADPSSLRVVTSDAGLSERVRAAGATVAPAGSFRRRLDRVHDDR